MLEEIAEKLDFKYELYLTPDNNYGGKNLDGGWNGLVGEVYYGVCMPFYSLTVYYSCMLIFTFDIWQ